MVSVAVAGFRAMGVISCRTAAMEAVLTINSKERWRGRESCEVKSYWLLVMGGGKSRQWKAES
jgi:hypothetical protein